jgi:hypothetical protein
MSTNPIPPDTEGADDGSPACEFVTIPRAELESLRARLQAAQSSTGSVPGLPADHDGEGRPDGARSVRADAPNVGPDRRLAELERSCRAAVRDREIATALAGRPLVSGAAAQLIRLWRDEFDVFEGDSGFEVATRDGRTVARAVTDWLESPEYAHFCLPNSRGGTGARDASRPASLVTAHGAPKNLGEAVVMKWRDESVARTETLLKPIGLRRHR